MSESGSSLEAYNLMRAGRLSEALPFAEKAVAGVAACLPAHGMLATLLLQLGRTDEADRVISSALQLQAGDADAHDALAYAALRLGQHDRANALYKRTTKLAPHVPRFWYNLACSERSFGRLTEAEAACDHAIALDGTQYGSYLLRAELRVQTADANHVEELQRRLTRAGADDRATVFLGYALAKELDDLQRFDDAFRWFKEAADTRKRRLAYDVALDEHKLLRIQQVFPGPAAPGPIGQERSSRYIFIVGLPRTGTTLVERILMGLPGVRSNGETNNFSRALLDASPHLGQEVADVFTRAAAADPALVAAKYMHLANVGVTAGSIVEKLPMNYLYLGAIQRALPEATLLVLKRSPLDSCFAMYRTLFGEGYPFSYDFEDLARYYAAYDRLMKHWNATLGPNLHEIVYEDLVSAPAQVGAQIARACGLGWNDAAIDIQKNAAVSLTASASQVRRPIYGSSSGRWRHYRLHLEPLILALRRQGIALPEDVWR